VWVVSKHELYKQLDQILLVQAQGGDHGPFGSGNTLNIHADGDRTGNIAIPVTSGALAVSHGTAAGYTTNTTIQKIAVRELVVPLGGGGAVISVYPLGPTQHALARIRFWILLVSGIGIAVAAALAAFVASAALKPVRRLTAAAENVAATGDLTERVDARGSDELGRLASRFNGMLAALEESVGRQRRLVADASHELRTPLTSVLANLELLSETLHGEEAGAARSALRSSHRMRRLVEDLLLLARADVGRERVKRPFDLADVVIEAAGELGPLSAGHVVQLDARPAPIEGMRDDVQRVAINLIENALRHTPPGTHVAVSTRPTPDGGAVLVVSDDGPGIAADLAPRLFERFVRGSGDRGGSVGLGLAIVAAVAEAHNGDVAVDRSPAGGARFVVRFGTGDDDAPAVAAAEPRAAATT
jgi:signal transduction histidine kinase